MNTPHTPEIFNSLSMYMLAIIALAKLTRRVFRAIQSLDKTLSKSFWRKLVKGFNQAIKCLIKEITPPNSSPNVTKAGKVILAALFYVLVLDCTCLLFIDGILISTSDAVVWRKLLGAVVLFVIVLAGRFCFTQGEKLRIEMNIDSHPLW
jgi:hypothetical protein